MPDCEIVSPDISIHTPAKGVTFASNEDFSQAYISIHTPAKGVTIAPLRRDLHQNDFNPHSREGSDVAGSDFSFPLIAFQSTLPRRE